MKIIVEIGENQTLIIKFVPPNQIKIQKYVNKINNGKIGKMRAAVREDKNSILITNWYPDYKWKVNGCIPGFASAFLEKEQEFVPNDFLTPFLRVSSLTTQTASASSSKSAKKTPVIYRGTWQERTLCFVERIIVGNRGDCGFQVLGCTREEGVRLLLANAGNEYIRRLAGQEIYGELMASDNKIKDQEGRDLKKRHVDAELELRNQINTCKELIRKIQEDKQSCDNKGPEDLLGIIASLPQSEALCACKNALELAIKTDKESKEAFVSYCRSEKTYTSFITDYVVNAGWLSFGTEYNGASESSILDALAEILKIEVVIWKDTHDQHHNMQVLRHFKPTEIKSTKHFHHTDGATHYNELVSVLQQDLTPSIDNKLQEEKSDEKEENKDEKNSSNLLNSLSPNMLAILRDIHQRAPELIDAGEYKPIPKNHIANTEHIQMLVGSSDNEADAKNGEIKKISRMLLGSIEAPVEFQDFQFASTLNKVGAIGYQNDKEHQEDDMGSIPLSMDLTEGDALLKNAQKAWHVNTKTISSAQSGSTFVGLSYYLKRGVLQYGLTTAGDSFCFYIDVAENENGSLGGIRVTCLNKDALHHSKNPAEVARVNKEAAKKLPLGMKAINEDGRLFYRAIDGSYQQCVNVFRGTGDDAAIGHSKIPEIFFGGIEVPSNVIPIFVLASDFISTHEELFELEAKITIAVENFIATRFKGSARNFKNAPDGLVLLGQSLVADAYHRHGGERAKHDNSSVISGIATREPGYLALADGHGVDGKLLAEQTLHPFLRYFLLFAKKVRSSNPSIVKDEPNALYGAIRSGSLDLVRSILMDNDEPTVKTLIQAQDDAGLNAFQLALCLALDAEMTNGNGAVPSEFRLQILTLVKEALLPGPQPLPVAVPDIEVYIVEESEIKFDWSYDKPISSEEDLRQAMIHLESPSAFEDYLIKHNRLDIFGDIQELNKLIHIASNENFEEIAAWLNSKKRLIQKPKPLQLTTSGKANTRQIDLLIGFVAQSNIHSCINYIRRFTRESFCKVKSSSTGDTVLHQAVRNACAGEPRMLRWIYNHPDITIPEWDNLLNTKNSADLTPLGLAQLLKAADGTSALFADGIIELLFLPRLIAASDSAGKTSASSKAVGVPNNSSSSSTSKSSSSSMSSSSFDEKSSSLPEVSSPLTPSKTASVSPAGTAVALAAQGNLYTNANTEAKRTDGLLLPQQIDLFINSVETGNWLLFNEMVTKHNLTHFHSLTNEDGNTILHAAMKANRLDDVGVAISNIRNHASMSDVVWQRLREIKNSFGLTPLEYAEQFGHPKLKINKFLDMPKKEIVSAHVKSPALS